MSTTQTNSPARKRATAKPATEQQIEAPRPAEQPRVEVPAYEPKPRVPASLTANEWNVIIGALAASATEARNMMREFEQGSRERQQWLNRSQFIASVEYRVRQQVQS